MPKTLRLLWCIAFMAGAVWPVRAAEYRAPLMAQAPRLDGRIEAKEWAAAAGFDGFAWENRLERRRVRAYVGATATHLYLAVISQLPVEGALTTQANTDTLKIVYDDSLEVWVDPTPGSEHGRAFQLLANAAGRKAYQMHTRGNIRADPGWRGDWTFASGFHDGYWQAEIAVPVDGIAPGRRADEGSWGINLCRNWKQPWAFSSLGGGGYAPGDIRFTFAWEEAPAVGWLHRTDPATRDIRAAFVLTNPSPEPLALRLEAVLKRDKMPEANRKETLTLRPGETREIPFEARDETSTNYELILRAASEDGRTLYYSRSYRWQAGPAWEWKTARPEVLPVDFQFAYYPYLNRMRILADVSGLPARAALNGLTAAIRPRGSRKAVKIVRFDRFTGPKQEKVFALPPLRGSYEIAVSARGKNAPAGEVVKPFERTRYVWEYNKLGRSAKVYPPFTPIRVKGRSLSTVLRTHLIGDSGLWDQVTAAGRPLLSAPMRFRAAQGGRDLHLRSGPVRFPRIQGHETTAESSLQGEGFRALLKSTWEYDGLMRLDMTLLPGSGRPLDALTLEIPLKESEAPLLHAMGDGIRNTLYERVPPGQGVVWTAQRVQANDFPAGFCTYIYIGGPKRGLSWFAENDRGWGWDRRRPNLELVRSGPKLTLRIHLVNRPLAIRSPRTLTFGLLAAPVKPRISPWRHRFWSDSYTILGTDINWFALGNCGSVYPAGKDMRLWQMIRRGNRERLSDEEVEKAVRHARKYFEPYGPEYVESFERHVRYNLRSRYGMKMIFYYNRSSYQAADEFQTFQDEWCLTDYRTVGPGSGVGEIPIVPSDSYIDHALYWYGKSFDIGGNQGVYWDNWFFNPSYNTMTTAAYKGEGGAVAPSTGVWGLRKLSKRTFQYMNERKMLPVTMPHMTSTNILPIHSFATLQYDWEWKYSEGDFQYRFPREYILLVTNGELAGTWPVLLGDHGNLAEDPWTQRTFAAVCIVHELTPSGALRSVWDPLLNPVLKLLGHKNLKVYRYWDETPQPAQTDSPDLLAIVYSVPSKEALVAVTSYAEQDVQASVRISAKALGFPAGFRALDAETGQELPAQGGTVSFPLKKHDIRELRILPVAGGTE
ncbi:MAG: hypothetical protein IT210_11215 [Armatimonadetes bacterium]|nr:hypothetical protein [Armatimonadota bacterium]